MPQSTADIPITIDIRIVSVSRPSGVYLFAQTKWPIAIISTPQRIKNDPLLITASANIIRMTLVTFHITTVLRRARYERRLQHMVR